MTVPLDNVLCLDFEASAIGDDSYPIEVAVVDCLSGECQSWLIRPTERWRSHGVWSAEAAAVHGLTLSELVEQGLLAQQVAREVSAWCDGKTVLCDGGKYDRHWLATLFATIDVAPPFKLGDFHEFAWDLAIQSRRRPDIAILRSESEAQVRFPVVHRAGADARYLAEVIRLLAGWA